MDPSTNSVPATSRSRSGGIFSSFAALLLSSLLAAFIPSASAQGATVEIGSGVLDRSLADGPRRTRVNFDPLISGTHTVRVAWDSDADIRFSIFQLVDAPRPDDRVLIGRSDNTAALAEWTGSLDASERYFLSVWSVAGSGNFSATIEAEEAASLAITTQPASLSVAEGEEATFTVAATGSGALGYRWSADGTAIPGATGSTLTVGAVTLGDSGTVYSVEVSDDSGSIGSDGATLNVTPVSIDIVGLGTVDSAKQSGPRWVRLDFDSLGDAVHTVTVSWDSDADVRFKVQEANGVAVSPTVRGSNPGVWQGALGANRQYYIGLWSTSGIANYIATVEASLDLAITSQPTSLSVIEGDDATFTVEAVGGGGLGYQWFADGSPLAGETADRLTVLATSLVDDGTEYTVAVSDGLDTVTSDAATLSVNETVVLGLFSDRADSSAWMLEGPARTLDYNANANTDGWGRVLLRVGNLLLVGGDFEGIKPRRNGPVTSRPFLAALNAVSGQPVSTFQVPDQVDSVVRSLVLSPDGRQVYVGGDFGLLALDATTGELDMTVSVTGGGGNEGRVFDVAVTDAHLYIGGDFSRVNNESRANIARLSIGGELDPTWRPNVTFGFSAGRSAPVQSLAVSPSGATVYVGGNFQRIDEVSVPMTPQNKRVSMLSLSAEDGTVLPERFVPDVGGNTKGVTAHDIVVTEFYVIVAWGGPNHLTFHSLAGDRLKQYNGKGDVQSLQVLGDHVFVGHHGEFFGSVSNPIPQEAVESVNPRILVPYKFHSFRIDDPSFLPEQSWKITGAFGVWGVAASEDSIWVAGEMSKAGSNDRAVEGLARFPARP